MDMNEDKLRALLNSYNVQQRECGDLQVQIEQREAEIHMKIKHIDKVKNTLDGDLKAELIGHQKDETKLQETLKNLEREIKLEKMEKNDSYLKIVAAEGEPSAYFVSFFTVF
jgi:chromosome segregation ATPase